MANSILNKNATTANPTLPKSFNRANPMQTMQQFQQFRNNFRGNPQQMVQQMLQNGQITETQLQQAAQMAKQFQSFVK